MQRHQIRELLDLVPQTQLDKVADLIRCISHPAQVRRDSGRYGDLVPVSQELLERLEEARRDGAETFTTEEIMAELGRTLSVKRSDKTPLPALALFLDPSPLSDRSIDGLDPAWVFAPYEADTERFTTRMADHLDVYAALRLLFSGAGE